MVNIGNDWDELLNEEFNSEYYKNIREFLMKEYKENVVYPKAEDIFNSLKLTSFKDCKVVIIGQDPYHQPNQAHGLSFSVQDGVKIPPSLKNIYKELSVDMNIKIPSTGDLTTWAKQGVLLLNSTLTVREGKPASHKNIGWENLTNRIIEILNKKEEPVVFILWGNHAKEKERLITNKKHLIITGAHPSPFSAYNGFFGGRYFSKTNDFLKQCGLQEIDWRLE